MPKTIDITIGDDGIEYDLDGFSGQTCFAFTAELEAALKRDHGVHVGEKSVRRKATPPAPARQAQHQTGGA